VVNECTTQLARLYCLGHLCAENLPKLVQICDRVLTKTISLVFWGGMGHRAERILNEHRPVNHVLKVAQFGTVPGNELNRMRRQCTVNQILRMNVNQGVSDLTQNLADRRTVQAVHLHSTYTRLYTERLRTRRFRTDSGLEMKHFITITRSTIGDRTFPATAELVWNSLPESIRSSPSLQVLRSRLKTELFARSYSHD